MSQLSRVRVLVAGLAILPCLLLLVPVASVVAVLLAIAAAARALGRALEAPITPWSEVVTYDARLGWRPRPDLDVHYLAENDDVFHLETDAEGWPGRRSLEESDIVVVGDSFAFGYGIDTARSFAALARGHRVKAVGAPGYSMVHGVLLLEHFGPRLKDKLVVWLVYLENDLQDNLAPEMRQYRAPFASRGTQTREWWIEDRHLSPAPWTCSDLDRRRLFPRLCVPGPLADRAYAAADYLIARARQACLAAGARLVLVTVPHVHQLTASGERALAAASGDASRCDAGLPDRELARSCRLHGVQMIAGRHHLVPSDYKRREGVHWSPRGHRRIAALIGRLADSMPTGDNGAKCPAPSAEIPPRLAVRARALLGRRPRSSPT